MINENNFGRRQFLKTVGKSALLFAAGPVLSEFVSTKALASTTLSREILDLRSLLGSSAQLFVPGQDLYGKFQNGFNLRTPSIPQAVLLPSSLDLLPRVMEWSQKTGIPLHVRSGGHSYEGYSSGSGVVIDLQRLNNIQIDTTRGLARIQAGAKLFQVAQTLAEKGFMLPAGSCPTVGISGLTLGGGIGLSSRKFGLTCDNLQGLRAITADGRSVVANNNSESDLFWASRGGGGGNFALVTDFDFTVHAVVEVLFFQYRFDSQIAFDVIQAWQENAPYMVNEITANLSISGSATGLSDVKITGQYIGKNSSENLTEDLIKNAMLPILKQVSPKQDPHIGKKSYFDAVKFFAGGESSPEKVFFKAASDIAMQPLSADGLRVLLDRLGHISNGAVAVMFDSYGGAIRDLKVDDTAFAHRKALYSVQYYSQWGHQTDNASRIALVRSVRDAMKPYFSGRAYVNYIDADLQNKLDAYFAENAERLLKIKNFYDPKKFFGRR